MNTAAVITIVGSVASVIGLLIPSTGWKSRLIHVAYGIAITALASTMFYYQTQLSELTQLEYQAASMVQKAELSTDGSRVGFMLASLAFLEKYKDRFPDTYARAKMIVDSVGVFPLGKGEFKSIDGASAIKYLLQGISAGKIN